MKLNPRLTAEGVLLARRTERFRPVAEHDGRGWVVGYGHRASAREGARVTEADATALLAYDLSQSAGRTEPLLQRPVSPALFDSLNAYAWRIGPEAFARSEVLRRVNGGEAVTPDEVAAAPDRSDEPAPSAVVLAAEAVRDRLAQVLTEPEPPPPRPPREPWPDPVAPSRPDEPALAFAPEDLASDFEAAAVAPRSEEEPPEVAPSFAPPHTPEAEAEEPPPPPFISPVPADAPHGADVVPPLEGLAPPSAPVEPHGPPAAFDEAAGSPLPPSAPMVSFERGGRARLWERVRANPYVYMAVGACGLALFACALLGFLLGRPTAPGFVLGVVGVICMAPALAFFLHRRRGG